MSPDFLITGSSTIEEEIILPQNTTSVQEKISSEAPNKKTSPNTNTRSSSRRKGFLKSSRSSPISLNKGSNSPSVYQIDLLPSQNSDTSKNTSSLIPNSRAPISMRKLAQRDENDSILDSRTSQSVRSVKTSRSKRSSRSERPVIQCKTYVFGFKNESSYIPKAFIPSHKPKPAPERPKSARMQPPIREYKESSIKLSSRRELGLKPMSPVCHSVILGNFDDSEIENSRKF